MNILICTDIFRNGGLETHILTFSKYLYDNGFKLFLSTDGLSKKYLKGYKILFKDILYLQDIYDLDLSDFVKASNKIADFITKENIDAVICHPFGTFVYAVNASIKTNRPYFLVFHGPTSVNPSYASHFQKYYDLWFKQILLPKASHSFFVSYEVGDLLKEKSNFSNKKMSLLLNPVSVFSTPKILKNQQQYIFFASRIDKDKYDSIISSVMFFTNKILPSFPDLKLYIAGDGSMLDELKNFILKENLSKKVKLVGFLSYPDMMSMITNSKLVMGMGRVCLESILLRKRVILAGYDGLKGLVGMSNIEAIGKSNFSGRGIENCKENSLYLQISPVLRNKKDLEISKLYKYVKKHYGVSEVGGNFISTIRTSINNRTTFYTESDIIDTEIAFSYPTLIQKEEELREMERHKVLLEKKIFDNTKELENIKNSRGWKLISKIRKIRSQFFRENRKRV